MPCDNIILNTVELDKVADSSLLMEAVRDEFGEAVSEVAPGVILIRVGRRAVEISRGRVTGALPVEDLQRVTGQVKQAVARVGVIKTASRFGWMVRRKAGSNVAERRV